MIYQAPHCLLLVRIEVMVRLQIGLLSWTPCCLQSGEWRTARGRWSIHSLSWWSWLLTCMAMGLRQEMLSKCGAHQLLLLRVQVHTQAFAAPSSAQRSCSHAAQCIDFSSVSGLTSAQMVCTLYPQPWGAIKRVAAFGYAALRCLSS